MKVQLTYFKDTGKFYSEGSYETDKAPLYEIWDEVREMIKQGTRPGLAKGCHEFHTLINVPGHVHEHPRLILNAA